MSGLMFFDNNIYFFVISGKDFYIANLLFVLLNDQKTQDLKVEYYIYELGTPSILRNCLVRGNYLNYMGLEDSLNVHPFYPCAQNPGPYLKVIKH